MTDDYTNWTPKRAARVGYLIGRGCSMEEIIADAASGVASMQSLRNIAHRWNLPLPDDVPALPDHPRKSDLTEAATARGMTVDQLGARLLGIIVRDNLVDAILDERG